MLTLEINTADPEKPSLALFFGKKILAKKEWRGNYDESEKILPEMKAMFDKTKNDFSDIQKIVVVRGPGAFSSVRIGVTIANALGFALKIPVYGKTGHGKKLIKSVHCAVRPLYGRAPNISRGKGIWNSLQKTSLKS